MTATLAVDRVGWVIQNTVMAQLPPHSPYPPQLLGPDDHLLWFDDLPEAERYSTTWGRILDENIAVLGLTPQVSRAYDDFSGVIANR
jgi:hypothetical protein